MDKLLVNTKRIQIRNLKTTDLSDFYAYRSNEDVTKFQRFNITTLEQSTHFLRRQKNKLFGQPGEWVHYGIEEIAIKKLIGDCAIKIDLYDNRMAETGITISHLYQKQGYAKEAMSGILNLLFNIKNMHRVVETVDSENIASINLMQSIGFRQEAHFIENIFCNGQWRSEIQFGMLNREWKLFSQ